MGYVRPSPPADPLLPPSGRRRDHHHRKPGRRLARRPDGLSLVRWHEGTRWTFFTAIPAQAAPSGARIGRRRRATSRAPADVVAARAAMASRFGSAGEIKALPGLLASDGRSPRWSPPPRAWAYSSCRPPASCSCSQELHDHRSPGPVGTGRSGRSRPEHSPRRVRPGQAAQAVPASHPRPGS